MHSTCRLKNALRSGKILSTFNPPEWRVFLWVVLSSGGIDRCDHIDIFTTFIIGTGHRTDNDDNYEKKEVDQSFHDFGT